MKTGKNGGRPKKETIGFEKEKTIGSKDIKTKTKPNVNENDNVNVNENVNENNNVGDSCVDGLQEIIEFYNENIGLITPYGLEILSDYAKEMSVDLIILAMKKSVEANIKTVKYIKGILNNWSKKGIKTVLEAEQEDMKFKEDNKKQEVPKETKEEKLARWKKEWGAENEN